MHKVLSRTLSPSPKEVLRIALVKCLHFIINQQAGSPAFFLNASFYL